MTIDLSQRQWQITIVYGSAALSCAIHYVVFLIARFLTRRTPWNYDLEIVKKIRWPTFFIAPVAIVLSLSSFLTTDNNELITVRQIFTVLLIISISYLVCNLIKLTSKLLIEKNQLGKDNVQAQIAQTQIQVFKRMCYGFVISIGIACAFFTFPVAWQLGASLMASAGVLGLAVGVAAKPIIENTLASFIIAITKPILLDDEVYIDDNYGRIESIRSTYVVFRTWDSRRYIIPLTYFLSNIFQNWSRVSPWKIGSVFIYVDPNADVYTIRQIFLNEALPESGDLWDGKVANLSVTDMTKEGLIELRFIASSKNHGINNDLKTFIREYMIEEIRIRWPYALTRTRIEIVPTLISADADEDENFSEGYYEENSKSIKSRRNSTASVKDAKRRSSLSSDNTYPDSNIKQRDKSDNKITFANNSPSIKNAPSPSSANGKSANSPYAQTSRGHDAAFLSYKKHFGNTIYRRPDATFRHPNNTRRKNSRADAIIQTPISTLYHPKVIRDKNDPNVVIVEQMESFSLENPSLYRSASNLNSDNMKLDPTTEHEPFLPSNMNVIAPPSSNKEILDPSKNPGYNTTLRNLKRNKPSTSKRKESIISSVKWIDSNNPNLSSSSQMRPTPSAHPNAHPLDNINPPKHSTPLYPTHQPISNENSPNNLFVVTENVLAGPNFNTTSQGINKPTLSNVPSRRDRNIRKKDNNHTTEINKYLTQTRHAHHHHDGHHDGHDFDDGNHGLGNPDF